MQIEQILAEIDDELGRLRLVKALLGGNRHGAYNGASPSGRVKRKRRLSAESREKIAAAQRKRWAKQKRAEKKAA